MDYRVEVGTLTTEGEPIIYGRFLPGSGWSDAGSGQLWAPTEDVLRAFLNHLETVANVLPEPLFQRALQGVSERVQAKTVRLDSLTFLALLAAVQVPNCPFTLSPELDLIARTVRLALAVVLGREVIGYSAPVEAEWPVVVRDVGRLASAEEDGMMHWSAHTEGYAAMWMPAWRTPSLRALYQMYESRAEVLLLDGWTREMSWSRRLHGRMLLSLWCTHAVDGLTRCLLSGSFPLDTLSPSSNTPYRIAYRGETEVLSDLQHALFAPVSDLEERRPHFAADGWLLWRVLRQAFVDSGWRDWDASPDYTERYYRLEFELVPPTGMGAGEWKLVYEVAHTEFEARAAVKDWWKKEHGPWEIGHDRLKSPDRFILRALRQAAEICEPVARSLREVGPSYAVIPSEGLLEFITEDVPRLVNLGFRVHTPALQPLGNEDIRIRVRVKRGKSRHTQLSGGRAEGWFDLQQVVDFDWTVVVDDKELSKEAFEFMVDRQMPFIQLEGSWRIMPVQEILNQVQALHMGRRTTNASLLQLAQWMLAEETDANDPDGIPVDVAFQADALDVEDAVRVLQRAQAPELSETPAGFHGRLRSYQQTGFSWLAALRDVGLGGCLADDMGLGKTIQVLAYLQLVKENHLAVGPHLLVCPTSLLQNWQAEIERFTPALRVYVHHGAGRNQETEGVGALTRGLASADLVITTYATVVRDSEQLCEVEWDVIVADEAQNIKNMHTKQAHALRALRSRHRIALTGTPVENRLEELWSILQFTTPGYLGNLSWFRHTFAGPIAQNPRSSTARRLNQLLRPILLRRRKTDPVIQIELPEKWEIREYAGLTSDQAALYQGIVNQLFTGIGETRGVMSRRGQILAALVRLKQLCDHPCLVTGGSADPGRSGKLKLLLDLLEDVIDEEEAALVFTQFRDMGDLICDAVEDRFGVRPSFLHGGLSASRRGQVIDAFQSGIDKSPVLVLSLKAGGVGLNLTRANHVFHFDRWWNPAVEDQATDRAFRIGQTKDVQVHKFVCSGTLEERIDAMILSKRTLSQAVAGESEGWIADLDDATLREFLILRNHSTLEDD